MTIDKTNVDDISETDLLDLIHAGVPEGLLVEYKREPYGNSDAAKKEALKDITAFANSSGGHLIIGMEESNGAPTALVGLTGSDADAVMNRLESLARDGVEPRIVGIRMRAIPLTGRRAAIIVRVPKSWNPPHRVTTGGTNRFYVRNSNGVHEASVEELRAMFTLADSAQERMKKFQLDRLNGIAEGRGPVRLAGGGRLVIHLLPLSAFNRSAQINLESAYKLHETFRPISAMGMTPRFNLDGFINVRGGDQCFGYTQVFRNGSIEATKADILRQSHDVTFLPAGSITESIAEVVPLYFEGLRSLPIPPPIVLMVSFLDVVGARLATRYDSWPDENEPLPPFNPLLLPETIVDDYMDKSGYQKALRPIFDALWNAAGFARCTYYKDGVWAPPK